MKKLSKDAVLKIVHVMTWLFVIVAAIGIIMSTDFSYIKTCSDVQEYMQEADSTKIDFYEGEKHFQVYTPEYLFSVTYTSSIRFQQEAETTAIIYDTTGHAITYVTDVDSVKKVVENYFSPKHR